MIEPLLQSQLDPVVQRHRRLRFWRQLAVSGVVLAVLALILWKLQSALGLGRGAITALIFLSGGISVLAALWRSNAWSPDFRNLARQIEQQHPELHALLLTAVEQQPDPETGKLTYLQERVVGEAVAESEKHQWLDAISGKQIFSMQLVSALAVAILVMALLGLQDRDDVRVRVAGMASPGASATSVTVTPGDVLLEKGEALVVLARFSGRVPAEATLAISATNQEDRRLGLTKSLDDPVFGGSIQEVAADFTYRVQYANQSTRPFQVKVFEYPRLERSDAQITFPDYTSVAPKKIEDTRRISAVEGSRLDLSLHLNKPVASAKLVSKTKKVVPLVPTAGLPSASLQEFPLESSETYELQLVDAEGRTNKVPAQFVFEVLKNRPPELKLATPKGDQRVSPLQEMTFQAEISDDFGLQSYGLAYTVAGKETKFVPVNEAALAHEKRQFHHLLSLEELSVQPDDLISYYLWADDMGPDGKVRRTSGDMYFAEVRPFEEIFREAQGQESPPGEQQQQGQGNEATKLADLQKQIINATWKLQRQEGLKKEVSDQYKKDAPIVQDSQQKALDEAESLKSRVRDATAASALETAQEQMEKALARLTEATNSAAPLPSALEAEQAAYQALLKLQAREYEVSRRRNSQGGQAGDQRNQQQLDQLDLKQEEDRYETQRQAAPQQTAQQKEQLQVLNRLKELAQRQQDVNERLKELQNALQEAKTEAEKEELRRQLKRLRDEEREMLADVDELRQQMEKSQSNMAEARQKLEKTRSDVQRASEALEKEEVSKALAAGTRAERDLEELRDDFRKKNSNEFAEEMRQMRADARNLSQKQNEIGEKLTSLAESKRRTLSDSGEVKQLAERLEGQQNTLTNLLNRMGRVSQDAETSEPLLSKQLYDSVRKSSQKNLEKTLDISEELLKQNFLSEAGKFEQRARQDIDELKKGVEKAAESVLGDESEALKLAKRELDALSEQLEREMAQATGEQQKSETESDPSQSGKQGAKSGKQGGGKNAGPQEPGEKSDQADRASAEKAQDSDAQDQQTAAGSKPGQEGQLAKSSNGQQGGSKPGQQPGKTPGESEASAEKDSQDKQETGERQETAGAAKSDQNGQQAKAQNSQAAGKGKGGQQPGKGEGQQESKEPGEAESTQAAQQGQGKGNQPSSQQAQGKGQGSQPGKGQPQTARNGQPGEQQQSGQKEGQGQGKGEQAAQAQQANARGGQGQQGKGEQPGNQPRKAGQRAARGAEAATGGQSTTPQIGKNFFDQRDGTGPGGPEGPLTGTEYANWADRLGNVEELLDQPELRTEVSRVRDRARAMRSEFKRHGKEPQWPLVKAQISAPLAEVRQRVAEELARRESKDALVPIDRDPVPSKFSDLVRRYYERLGSTE